MPLSTNDKLPSAPPTPTPLIAIEDCVADQLVGDKVARLASGTLQLYAGGSGPPELVGPESISKPTSEVPDANLQTKGALTLRVGTAAFSLEPSLTTAFTHAENARWYFFSLTLPPKAFPSSPSAETSKSAAHTAVGSGSYVRLTLPEGITIPGSILEKQRDVFEDVLIGRGFLSGDPVLSATDEIARSISQEASAAVTIRERTQQHTSISSVPKPKQESFSPTTHSFIDGRTKPEERRSSMTEWAAETLANVSIAVGERVASIFGIHIPTEEEQLEAGVASPSTTQQFAPTDQNQNRREDLDTPDFVTGSATPSEGGLVPTPAGPDATPVSRGKLTDEPTSLNLDTHEGDFIQDLQVKNIAEGGLSSEKPETSAPSHP